MALGRLKLIGDTKVIESLFGGLKHGAFTIDAFVLVLVLVLVLVRSEEGVLKCTQTS